MKPVSNEILIQQLHWRYATQRFDPARKIPEADWHALEQALVLAPSSIGLQPWKFIVVTDPAVKVSLRAAAWRQPQPEECSHFVVLAVRKELDAGHVARHIDRIVDVRGVARETLDKFQSMTLRNLDKARAEGRLDTWQTHQVYIALGQFMACAAMVGIDTCPMEGIDPGKFDEILGLTGSAYATVVACAAGYRSAEDKYATVKKVRFLPEDVIVRV